MLIVGISQIFGAAIVLAARHALVQLCHMQIELPPGKYVVAVSGGVDSVVLLDLLAQKARQQGSDLVLIVAHFDHGIRPDSADDRVFVEGLARQYGLPFVYDQAALGPGTSEARARDARYAFLRKVQAAARADALVLAHHQDDLLETIIINFLRGTKSRGLSSLRSTAELRRPLLRYTKADIRTYAQQHKLAWHEDSTNADESYLRNYVRQRIVPRMNELERQKLLVHSETAASLNDAIATMTHDYLAAQPDALTLDRAAFRALPPEVANEVLAAWLRARAPVTLSSKLISRLAAAITNGGTGTRYDVTRGYVIVLARNTATLEPPKL